MSTIESFAKSLFKSLDDLSEKDYFMYDGNTDVVFCYHEYFSDTSLGRGGMAGQAITRGLTVVVQGHIGYGVYRNGRLDYIVLPGYLGFGEKIAKRQVPSYSYMKEEASEYVILG